MQIQASSTKDLATIFQLYAAATAYQKQKFHRHWPVFERTLIEQEISEKRQWKVVMEGDIAAIFAITFNDEQIWKERSQDKALYLHRIATNPNYRGQQLLSYILDWAKAFCQRSNLPYIRLDAFGDNEALTNYYVQNGFTVVEVIEMEAAADLPAHYKGLLGLFEMKVVD